MATANSRIKVGYEDGDEHKSKVFEAGDDVDKKLFSEEDWKRLVDRGVISEGKSKKADERPDEKAPSTPTPGKE